MCGTINNCRTHVLILALKSRTAAISLDANLRGNGVIIYCGHRWKSVTAQQKYYIIFSTVDVLKVPAGES